MRLTHKKMLNERICLKFDEIVKNKMRQLDIWQRMLVSLSERAKLILSWDCLSLKTITMQRNKLNMTTMRIIFWIISFQQKPMNKLWLEDLLNNEFHIFLRLYVFHLNVILYCYYFMFEWPYFIQININKTFLWCICLFN